MDDWSIEKRDSRELTEAEVWLWAIGREMRDARPQLAEQALNGVFSALRRCLSSEALAQLGAPLPGAFQPVLLERSNSEAPAPYNRRIFMATVRRALTGTDAPDAEAATHAVLKVMGQKVPAEDANALRLLLPADLRGLWPERKASRTNGVWRIDAS